MDYSIPTDGTIAYKGVIIRDRTVTFSPYKIENLKLHNKLWKKYTIWQLKMVISLKMKVKRWRSIQCL